MKNMSELEKEFFRKIIGLSNERPTRSKRWLGSPKRRTSQLTRN